MLRTFELRLRPNQTQRAAFEEILRDSCETYNAALQERRDAWRLYRKSINYYDQCAELTELRQDGKFAIIALDIQREPLRRLSHAFMAFFRRCEAGERPGYPRFKSHYRYNSFKFGKPAIRNRRIKIPNLGWFKFKSSQELNGEARAATVKRIGNKWVVRLVCDIGPAPEKRAVATAVGIDVGLTSLATLSDGRQIENPRWQRKHEARIAAASRLLSRKRRRSKNRIRAREVVRRAHQRAADARKNYLHHVSKWLVSSYDLVAHEALNVRGMAQGSFAKSILDAAWGILLFQLKYKAEEAGTWVVPVNPRGTSIRCSRCGKSVPKTLADRQHICGSCGLSLDRDHNAAINVLRLGKSLAGIAPSEYS